MPRFEYCETVAVERVACGALAKPRHSVVVCPTGVICGVTRGVMRGVNVWCDAGCDVWCECVV